jgi:hypothetical protein
VIWVRGALAAWMSLGEEMGGSLGRRDGCAVNLKTEMAEGESAAVIGSTRLPAARVASPY